MRAAFTGAGPRLPMLVTTVEWLNGNAAGPFGRIWLGSDRARRRDWPEPSRGGISADVRDPSGKTARA